MRMKYRILMGFLILSLMPVMGAAAEWDAPEAWAAPVNVSEGSNLVVAMQVFNSVGNPVNPEDCDNLDTRYRYPPDSSEARDMNYIEGSDGYYFGEMIIANNSSVRIEAEGSGCSDFNDGDVSKEFEGFNTSGGLNVTLINDTDRKLLEGKEYSMWVKVVDSNKGFVPGADLSWNIYNWNGSLHSTGEMEEGAEIYTADVPMPTTGKRRYFMAFETNLSSDSFAYPFGGDARSIEVFKKLESELDIVDLEEMAGRTPRCSGDVKTCQKGAPLQARFRETKNHANSVEGNVTGNRTELAYLNFTRAGESLWLANFTIPVDIDTSNYSTSLEVSAVGKTNLDKSKKSKQIDIEVFRIRSESSSYVFQGYPIELLFGPEYPFTRTPLSRSAIKRVYLEIEYPNGTSKTLWNNIRDIPDKNYDRSLNKYRYVWDVPKNAPTGPYNFEVRMEGRFGEVENRTFNFEVRNRDLESTDVVVRAVPSSLTEIDSTTRAEKTFRGRGKHTGEIVLVNNGSGTAEVDVSFSGDLSNISSAKVEKNDGSLAEPPFGIKGGQARTVLLSLNFTEFKEYNGSIIFEVQGKTLRYRRDLEVSYDLKNPCSMGTAIFCLRKEGIVKNYTRGGARTINVPVENLNNETVVLSATPSEKISVLFSSPSSQIELSPKQVKGASFNIEPSPGLNGRYEGNITFEDPQGDSAALPVDINVDIPQGEMDLKVIGESDLGELVQGDSTSFRLSVRNVGETTLDDLEITSEGLNIDRTIRDGGNPVTVNPGGHINITVPVDTSTISPVEYIGDNKAVVKARSGSGVRDNVEVAIRVRKDIRNDLSRLEGKLPEFKSNVSALEGRINSEDFSPLEGNLEGLNSSLKEARQAWDQENYKEAQQAFSEAEDSAEKLRNGLGNFKKEIKIAKNTESGGLNIWLILVPLIVVLLVILVIYLSIVPDEEVQGGGSEGGQDYGPPV